MGALNSTSKYATFDVVLDQRSFSIGRDGVVRGHVASRVVHEIPVSSLHLRLRGKSSVGCGLERASRVFYEKWVTIPCAGEKFVAGVYQNDFCFHFDSQHEDLAPSLDFHLEKDDAVVRWDLEVYIKAPGWFSFKEHVHSCRVQVTDERETTAPVVVSRKNFHLEQGFAFFQSKGDLVVHGIVPQRQLQAGGDSYAMLYMNNQSNVEVHLGAVSLVEELYLATNGDAKQAKVHKIKHFLGVPDVAEEAEEAWVGVEKQDFGHHDDTRRRVREGVFGSTGRQTSVKILIKLPLNLSYETFQAPLIWTRHKLVVGLNPRAIFSKALKVEVPITVHKPLQSSSASNGTAFVSQQRVADALPVAMPVLNPESETEYHDAVAAT
mmetsp:Transcript_23519/g.41571  ORF Transcript_23519/g.41571 Transcript_23519/m.41571 type:complete len:379 (-) Transcript_23519:26-1162(-)|eukprot:CAMPEP_0184547254 /NCGR_PEP_ID=MMETSP0199_2-20130426/5454_1 /TAXON_ID=1112570 /ORGANISM="Thraustochytrium sp., Strain LLF1b" /LENGTH=378 /DNA_ID=CAMNT_0026941725 /DNA_START=43 /DNA_END=1179 /DNA_ORIENTATION=-